MKLSFSTIAKLLRAEPLDDGGEGSDGDDGSGEAGLEWGPDFNVAPTERAPVLTSRDSVRRLALFRWGLVPFWASDPKVGARMINARAETVAEKPAFRDGFAKRRLLVPVSGWYEWTHPQPEPGARKKDKKKPTPHWIHGPEDDESRAELLLLAGLGARWVDKTDGRRLDSFCIITTDASESTRMIHDRMPVILTPAQQELWLDPRTPSDALRAMLAPYRGPLLHHVVDTAVNDVRADGEALIRPVGEDEPTHNARSSGQGDLGL